MAHRAWPRRADRRADPGPDGADRRADPGPDAEPDIFVDERGLHPLQAGPPPAPSETAGGCLFVLRARIRKRCRFSN